MSEPDPPRRSFRFKGVLDLLIGLGILHWLVTWIWSRTVRHRGVELRHPEELAEHHGSAPHN